MDIDGAFSPWEWEQDFEDANSPPNRFWEKVDEVKQIGIIQGKNGAWWACPGCLLDTVTVDLLQSQAVSGKHW